MYKKRIILGAVAVVLVALAIGWFARARASDASASAASSGTEATTGDADQNAALEGKAFYWKGDDGSVATLYFHGRISFLLYGPAFAGFLQMPFMPIPRSSKPLGVSCP